MRTLPDLTAFLACWAVLVAAAFAAVTLGVLTLDAFARWMVDGMSLLAAALPGILLGILAGSSYLILIVGANVLSTPYPELRDRDCMCGPGAHHPRCLLRGQE